MCWSEGGHGVSPVGVPVVPELSASFGERIFNSQRRISGALAISHPDHLDRFHCVSGIFSSVILLYKLSGAEPLTAIFFASVWILIHHYSSHWRSPLRIHELANVDGEIRSA